MVEGGRIAESPPVERDGSEGVESRASIDPERD